MEESVPEDDTTPLFLRDEEFEAIKNDPGQIRTRAEEMLRSLQTDKRMTEMDFNRRFNQLEQRLASCMKQNEVLIGANQNLQSSLALAGNFSSLLNQKMTFSLCP